MKNNVRQTNIRQFSRNLASEIDNLPLVITKNKKPHVLVLDVRHIHKMSDNLLQIMSDIAKKVSDIGKNDKNVRHSTSSSEDKKTTSPTVEYNKQNTSSELEYRSEKDTKDVTTLNKQIDFCIHGQPKSMCKKCMFK